MLASGGLDKIVRLWNPQHGRRLATLDTHDQAVTAIAFAPDASSLVGGTYEGVIGRWQPKDPLTAIVEPLANFADIPDGVLTVAVSPDGKLLASAGKDKAVTLRSVETQEIVRKLEGHGGAIANIAFSPDGELLAVALYGGGIQLWNVKTGQKHRYLKAHAKATRRVKFSPDGKRLASASEDKTAKLWDIATRKLLFTTSEQALPLSDVAFSPDGTRLVTSTGYWREWRTPGELRLWDAETGDELALIGAHDLEIKGVLFDRSGERLLSYGPQGVRVWDVAARKELASIVGGTTVIAAVLLPVGNHLATGHNDGRIILWNLQTSEPVYEYEGHGDLVFWLSCSSDGSVLASVARDGTVKLWPVELDAADDPTAEDAASAKQ
jgi:WD40 repeat protein